MRSAVSSMSSLSSLSSSNLSLWFASRDQDPDESCDVTENQNTPVSYKSLHCYELKTLLHLEQHSDLWEKITQAVKGDSKDNSAAISRLGSSLPKTLWFITLHLQLKSRRITSVARNWTGLNSQLLSGYLQSFNFTELYLDNTFDRGDEPRVPIELFRHCPSVRVLSLKNNFLQSIPGDIGRLSRLEKLYLTNNRLENWSLPYTLAFCYNLKEVYLDHNLLDALPSVLLTIPSLLTVHRHGNHNYFKATFMWYHTDVNGRILETNGRNLLPQEEFLEFDGSHPNSKSPSSLQHLSALAIISSKINFFVAPEIIFPSVMKNRIADLTGQVNLCGYCSMVKSANLPGYKVFTFKNPYLGNTCVPFLHWACSYICAENIEIPARNEQIRSASEQDRLYERYIRESMNRVQRPSRRAQKLLESRRKNEESAYFCSIS